MKKIIILACYIILISISLAKTKEQIEITADTMEWDKEKGEAIAIGNAKAIKSKTTITADKIVALLNSNGSAQQIKKLVAYGKVTFIREGETATGRHAIYDIEKDIIVLKGNVNLKRADNVMVGEKLVIDLTSGLSRLSSSKSDEKVKMKYNVE